MRSLSRMFLKRDRAISPVIATLLMIAIAVVASLVVYAWVMGYLGVTTSKTNEAITIQSFAKGSTSGNLIIYVQNAGQGTVKFDPNGSVYVNDELLSLQEGAFDARTLSPGQTATIATTHAVVPGETLKVKIVTTDGVVTEMKSYSELSSSSDVIVSLFSDSFSSGDLGQWSPYLSAGGTANVQSSIYHSSPSAAELIIPADSNAWAAEYYDMAAPQATMYCRAYVQVTALPVVGQFMQVSPNLAESNKGYDLVTVWIYNDAGTYKWVLQYRANDGPHAVYSTAQTLQTNTWYSIETKGVSSAGSGEARLYVNGIEVCTATGLSNNNYQYKDVYINIYSTNPLAVNSYVDDVIVRSTYIGP